MRPSMKALHASWATLSRGGFLLIMHEHLFIFRKPSAGERTSQLKESTRWWQ